MVTDLLAMAPTPWQNGTGDLTDIVLDSQVWLFRNAAGQVFPERADTDGLAKVLQAVETTVPALDSLGSGTYEKVHLAALSEQERQALVERGFTTNRHVEQPEQRGLLLREDGAVVVRINEEDHIGIHAAAAGLQLGRAWQMAAQVDDGIESLLDIAFRDDFGYLTCDPANAGTGLRAGVTMHLPALVMMKRFNRLVRGITKAGFAVRQLYSGQSERGSNIFVITNETTLGITEETILQRLQEIVIHVTDEERHCRDLLLVDSRNLLQDRLRRAYGILSQAWLMRTDEVLPLLSDVRLGIDLGMVSERPLAYEASLAMMGPGMISLLSGQSDMTEETQDAFRAQIIRETLAAYAV